MNRDKTAWSAAPAAMLLLASAMVAAGDHPANSDPVAQKFLEMDGHGNVTGLKHEKVARLCFDEPKLLETKTGWDALAGEPDPDLAPFWEEGALYHVEWDEWTFPLVDGHGRCGNLDENQYYGPVMWDSPGVTDKLVATIESPEKLEDLVCRGKEHVYRALWFNGDPEAVDPMIEGMKNDKCTTRHIEDGLAVMHNWPLTQMQTERIQEICIAAFQGTSYADKNKVKGCLRFLGFVESDDVEVFDFMVNYLGDSQNQTHAARALGQIGNKKAKGPLRDLMLSASGQRSVKKGKKNVMVDVVYGRDETVAAAVALVGMGDKEAMKYVDQWLTIDLKDETFFDMNGFEAVFLTAPFASDAAHKKLQPKLVKAFKQLQKLAKKDSNRKDILVRCAAALLQSGNEAGLTTVIAALEGNDQTMREEALEYIGGEQNYWSGYRDAKAGLSVGGKHGLAASDAEKIVDVILEKQKFWSDGKIKKMGALAILDIRARIEASRL